MHEIDVRAVQAYTEVYGNYKFTATMRWEDRVGFYLKAEVVDVNNVAQAAPIKKISLIMGHHPVYYPDFNIGVHPQTFATDRSSFQIGPWPAKGIEIPGGDAHFHFADGHAIALRGFRCGRG